MLQCNVLDNVFATIGVKSSEKNLVLWSMLLAFIAGCVQCYIWTVPYALFLANYSGNKLPQVYLAVAAFGLLCGVIYPFFQSRLPFNRVTVGLFVTLACVATIFWVAITGVGSKWMYLALIIWAMVAFDLADFGVWLVLNRIYTLQQGKRLFGIIGAFQNVGGIVSGFLMPVLVTFIKVEHIVLLTAFLIFIVAAVLVKLLKYNLVDDEGEQTDSKAEGSNQYQISFTQVLRNPFVLKILVMTSLVTFTMYTVDMFFNLSAGAHYPDENALAGFLGVFFGLSDCISLFIGSLVFAWLLERFGLLASLFILPAIGSIVSICILITNSIPSLAAVGFWLIALLKMAEECIRQSVTSISGVLLLQPLSPNIQAFVLSKNNMVIVPISTGIISLILMIVTRQPGGHVLFFCTATLASLISYALIVLTLKSNYIKALANAIAKRYFFNPIYQRPLKENLPLLKRHLNSKYPDEIVYSLKIIEEIDEREFTKELATALKSDYAIIRELALKKITQYHITRYDNELISILNRDSNDHVRAQVVRTIAELDYTKYRKIIENHIEDRSLLVRCEAIHMVFKHGHAPDGNRANETLSAMINSPDEETRRMSAQILGDINQPALNVFLSHLIQDQSTVVRQAAFCAVLKTEQTKLFNALFTHFSILHLTHETLTILSRLVNMIIPIIKTNFSSYTHANQIKLLSMTGQLNGLEVQEFLEKTILTSPNHIRQVALQSLVNMPFERNEAFIHQIEPLILDEIMCLKKQYHFSLFIPDIKVTQLLRDIFKRKINLSIERLLLLLAISYDKNIMNRARIGLGMRNPNEISYAIELMDNNLSSQHKSKLMPLLNTIYFSEAIASGALASDDFQAVLKEGLAIQDDDPLNILHCIACIYVIKEASLQALYPDVQALKGSASEIINETIEWASCKRFNHPTPTNPTNE